VNTGTATAGQQGSATLRDYLHVIRRRKWLLVQAVVIVPLAAVAFSLSQTPQYEATANVLLSRQNLANTLNGIQDPTYSVQPDRLAQTQADLARSRQVARRVIARVHPPGLTVSGLLDNSSVTPKQNADILEISVRNPDPRLAVRLASAYAAQYRAYRRIIDTRSVESAIAEVEQRIRALPNRNGALFASLVDKEQQLRTMEALQTSNAFVIDSPTKAVQVSPRPTRNGVLGLVLGLFLGVGLVFLRETLDTRVRTAQEAGERLGLPLLARIPTPSRRLRAADTLVMLAEPRGVHAEAFRMLRTNIEFVSLGKDVRTLMVTSPTERDGKSTTVANLAVALARAGQRVVLVDLDLRRPYLGKFFDLGRRPGITQVALGHARLADALSPVPLRSAIEDLRGASTNGNGGGAAKSFGRLAVIGAGAIPPDPGEFVASAELTVVLEELRELADVVLVDAPPLLGIGDAMTLSAKVDAVVLVTRLDRVRRPLLAETHRLLETIPAAKLGFVVTGSEGGDGYAYGYGYGYAPRAYERPEPERVR